MEGRAVYTTDGRDKHWENDRTKIDWYEDDVECIDNNSTEVFCVTDNDIGLWEVWVTKEVFEKLDKDVKVNDNIIDDYLENEDEVIDKNTLLKLLMG